MAFRIVDKPTFTHTVRVAVPCDGGHREETLSATYRVLETDAAEGHDLATSAGTADFLRASVQRLDDIVDDAGNAIPWSEALFDRMIRLPYVRLALVRGYFDGVAKARVGN